MRATVGHPLVGRKAFLPNRTKEHPLAHLEEDGLPKGPQALETEQRVPDADVRARTRHRAIESSQMQSEWLLDRQDGESTPGEALQQEQVSNTGRAPERSKAGRRVADMCAHRPA